VTTTPASPSPGRRAQSGAGDWPVLARLPDVCSQTQAEPQQFTQLATRASTTYRLDVPATAETERRNHDLSIDPERQAKFTTIISEGSPARPQPHLHHRTWRVDQAAPGSRRHSDALPTSNPFAIPSASLDEALAPIARFVMLFVLVTIAGTAILLAGKNRSKPEPASPSATAGAPVLEPTTVIETVRTVIEQPIASTTATGPSNDAPATGRDRASDSLPPFPDVLAPAADVSTQTEGTANEHVSSDPAASDAKPATSASEFLTSPLTGTGRPLPQVRTSEPPTSVAHLPGYILESPSRQASNDDEQSVY
jgi:hypothetical protein